MEKIWLNRYQQQVPAEINPDIYPSLNELFTQACQKFKEISALNFFNTSISYQQWGELSGQFARYLQKELKLKKGGKVALMLPNCPQYMISVFAVLQAGLTVVNVNPLYTTPELIQQIKHSQAETIVVLENFLPKLSQNLKETQIKHVISSELGDLLPRWRSWIIRYFARSALKNKSKTTEHFPTIRFLQCLKQAKHKHWQVTPPLIDADDIAFLQYTGGTTGVPKAAMLTHRNMLANIEQLTAWVRPILQERTETMITALPLYHIFSLMVNGLMGLRLGATNVLIPDARNIRQLIQVLNKHPFSVLLGVNTLFRALLKKPAFAKLDFSSLKIALGGGAPLQAAVKTHWKAVTGKLLLEGYGLTEASPVVCAPPWDLRTAGEHVGLPLPSTDIRLTDEHGHEVALGDVGELCIKGPQVMQGYWTAGAEESVPVFDSEGWLLSGDLARVDQQGFVFIVGRKKELILVSGFNVYPSEIENVIQKHPKVSEVAVIGVPSDAMGEAIKAFVVRLDKSLTAEELLNYCHHYLTGYKIPAHICFLDSLPKSSLGKILKKQLK